MRITKSQLRRTIVEEAKSVIIERSASLISEELESKDFNNLTRVMAEISAKLNKLFDIDASLDYLAAAITGEDPDLVVGRAWSPSRAPTASPSKAAIKEGRHINVYKNRGHTVKITKSQLIKVIKEELKEVRTDKGSAAVANAILDPHPSGLRKIATAAGARMTGMGNQATSPYNQILDEIEEYIRTDCARNIMEIVGRYQGDSTDPQFATPALQEGGYMGHYMETPAGDTPQDIAQALINSGQEITERSVEAAVIEAGALDDDIPDFVDEVMVALEHIQGAY